MQFQALPESCCTFVAHAVAYEGDSNGTRVTGLLYIYENKRHTPDFCPDYLTASLFNVKYQDLSGPQVW